jgi:hypothetical protein
VLDSSILKTERAPRHPHSINLVTAPEVRGSVRAASPAVAGFGIATALRTKVLRRRSPKEAGPRRADAPALTNELLPHGQHHIEPCPQRII